MLEQFSMRLTLSMGKLQNKLFYSFGHNVFKDTVIASAFQLLSFRKRAFFLQIFSFFNVGSFSKQQTLYILTGSFIGLGLSSLLFLFTHTSFALGLLVLGFAMRLQSKEQIKDLGMAAISLSLFFIALNIFDSGMKQTVLNIHQFSVSWDSLCLAVVLTSVFFRTPIAFLFVTALYHMLVGMNLWLMVVVFFLHGVSLLLPLYLSILNKKKRLYFSLLSLLGLQVAQAFLCLSLVFLFPELNGSWLQNPNFIEALQTVVLCYFVYFSLSLVLVSPFIFLLKNASFLRDEGLRRKPSQKIIAPQKRGGVFSIHFSLFLLRHEFIKMATLGHTILKLGREADAEEGDINEKLFRYQGVLSRVGDEIKDFCFSIGKQRAYRWHIQEILSYYKIVNQLELMVEDLSQIIQNLQKKDIEESWEKECRFWLNLQLRTYEVFFNRVAGVVIEGEEKVADLVKKSYECLDRMQKVEGLDELKPLSKAFYRVTENNGSLSLDPAKVVKL